MQHDDDGIEVIKPHPRKEGVLDGLKSLKVEVRKGERRSRSRRRRSMKMEIMIMVVGRTKTFLSG